MLAKIFCLVLILSITSCEKLHQVISFFRHGARNPTDLGWEGHLTQAGAIQQYIFGKHLNEKYVQSGYLDEQYNPNQIKYYSDNQQRCNYSAKYQLSGLYPSEDQDTVYISPSLVKLPPTEINNTITQEVLSSGKIYIGSPAIEDILWEDHYTSMIFEPHKACEYVKDLKYSWKENPDFLEWEEQQYDIYQEAVTIWNRDFNGTFDLSKSTWPDLKDIIGVRQCHEFNYLPYPNFSDELWTELIEAKRQFYTEYQYASEEFKKGVSTEVFRVWADITRNIMNNSQGELKYTGFSGHDTNLMMLLANLMSPETYQTNRELAFPLPFATNLQIEFFQYFENGSIMVRMLVNDVVYPMRSPCKDWLDCHIEDFLQLIESRQEPTLDSLCNSETEKIE